MAKNIRPEQIIDCLRKDLRRLATNNKGKTVYVNSLDAILQEIYGIKGLASKLLSNKKSVVRKVLGKFNYETLIKIVIDEKDFSNMRKVVLIHRKMMSCEDTLTRKEVKRYGEAVKALAKNLRRKYGIQKLASEDDITLKSVRSLIDDLNEEDDYYFDDDYDDYDDDNISIFGRDKKSSSTTVSSLARLIGSNRRDEYDDFDYDDDDEDKSEDDDELVDILKTLSRKVANLENAVNNPIQHQPAPVPQQKLYPLPTERAPIEPKSIDVLDAKLSTFMTSVSSAIGSMGRDIKMATNTLNDTIERVNDLSHDVDTIIQGFDDGDDSDMVSTPGDVSMSAVEDAFTNVNPIGLKTGTQA